MLRILLDENFNNDIMRGIIRRLPEADIVRVQDIPDIAQQDDPTILEWAAQNDRVMLTHDVQTMTKYAYERVQSNLPMPGVFELTYSPCLKAGDS